MNQSPEGLPAEAQYYAAGKASNRNRTDGETFVDLQTIDASALDISDESDWKYFQIPERSTGYIDLTKPIYRVEIDHDAGWPYHANGVEEDSLFEGIMYAG